MFPQSALRHNIRIGNFYSTIAMMATMATMATTGTRAAMALTDSQRI